MEELNVGVFRGEEVEVCFSEYKNGGCAILLKCLDGTPYATATVWVEGLQEGEVAVKDYSENEGMLDFLIDMGVVDEPHRYIRSGFVEIPICTVYNIPCKIEVVSVH